MGLFDRFRSTSPPESHPAGTGHDVELLTEALANTQLALKDARWERLVIDSEQASTRAMTVPTSSSAAT